MKRNGEDLNPKQATFVTEYMKHGSPRQAAITAGYAPKNATKQGYKLTTQCVAVMKAIDDARKSLIERTNYNADAAMVEIDDAIEFSKLQKNANALVKAVELKTKLCGLLIDRHDVRQFSAFQINISGIDDKEKGNIFE